MIQPGASPTFCSASVPYWCLIWLLPATVLLQVADECNSAAVFAVLRFSLDGSSLLAVVEGRVYVLDSFSGEMCCKVRAMAVVYTFSCGGFMVAVVHTGGSTAVCQAISYPVVCLMMFVAGVHRRARRRAGIGGLPDGRWKIPALGL